MNCHLSHSIKSVLCENFSDIGRKEGGKKQREQAMREKEQKAGVSEQGDCNRDRQNAGSEATSALLSSELLRNTGTSGLIAPEQNTNNHRGLGWPVLPCTALCQAKFDLSQAPPAEAANGWCFPTSATSSGDITHPWLLLPGYCFGS